MSSATEKKSFITLAPGAVEPLSALAPVFRHGAKPAVLTDGRARPVPAVDTAEAVRAGADVVADTESPVFTFRVARNWKKGWH